jgi:hypothetical protein
MKRTITIALLFAILPLFAQEEVVDPKLNKWVPSLVSGLNISQIAFENWSQGGENSLAYTLTADFKLGYKTERWNFRNQFKAAFGKTKLGDDEIRTTDNEFFLESVLSYHILGWAVNPYFSNLVRSSITTGYDYKIDPKLKIADFFDPGYITQSLGFTYDTNENFQTRLGVAFQETITSTEELAAKYSDDPETLNEIEKFKFETGIESVTDANFNLDENLLLTTKLRLFTRFEDLAIWDVRWDNTITAKVNNWLNVNLGVIVIHEVSQTKKTQLKEALQIGITYTIF